MKKRILTILMFFILVTFSQVYSQVELITNGTFDSKSNWQEINGATYDVITNAGKATVVASVTTNNRIHQNIGGLVPGEEYTVSGKYFGSLSNSSRAEVIIWNSDYTAILESSGNYSDSNDIDFSFTVTLDGDILRLGLVNSSMSGETNVWDNISVIGPTAGRIVNGLQAIYDFSEGSGTTVGDVSGVGTPLNLTIQNSSEVQWTPNGLYANLTSPIKSSSAPSKIIDACMASNEITLEAWVVPANLTQGSSGPVRVMTLSENSTNRNFALGQEVDSWDARLRTTVTSDNGLPSLSSGASTVEVTLSHLVYTRDNSGNAKFYIDGSLVQSTTLSGDFSNWNSSYLFGLGDEFGSNKTWEGLFYLSAVYSRALTQTEVTQNYLFGVDYDDKPIIISNPINQAVVMGQTATFSVEAIGEGNLSYQWQKDGNDISGANNSSYTTDVTIVSDNGSTFRCVVSNANGEVTSSSASLLVAPSNSRISEGQQVLYLFEQGSGSTVSDISGVGSALNLNITTPEAVEWTNSGLKINSPANIISDVAAAKIVNACKLTNEITIEAWVKPANSLQNGPARIITNSLDRTSRNFTFGQEYDDYQVGLRTSNTNNSGTSLNSNDGGALVELTHVVYTRSSIGVAKIFVNGVETARNDNLSGDFSTWDASYRLSIGNELLDQRPFEGLINMIAVFDRQLQRAEVEHNYSIGITPINNPTNLSATSSEPRTATISWVDNSTNEDGFIIERGEGVPTVYNIVDTVNENTINYIDSNLLDGKNYSYRVKAFNEINISDLSNVDTVLTIIPSPTNLVAESIVLGEINLIWEDNSNNEDGFNIERALYSEANLEFGVVGVVGANSESYIDESVQEGIKYVYRLSTVAGSNVSNYSNSVELYSKASFISKPTDLIIYLDESLWVPVLEWRDESFNELGFVVERRAAAVGSEFISIDTVGIDVETFTDTGATDSTSFIYRIYAYNDEFVSDLSSEVFIDVVGVEKTEMIPTDFILTQNYPNPFNPSTTIKFGLPSSADVVIKLYNLLGQEIFTMVDNNYSAGTYSYNFDASQLTSGIYIYSISAIGESGGRFVQSKKMTLLK